MIYFINGCFLCLFFLTVPKLVAKKLQDLQIIVEHKPGTCKEFAATGDSVHVEYTGMLENGNIFDSSVREGRSPLRFQLGSGTLIKGWERGIHGMCLGERRKLIIPPHLGYGSRAVGNLIPRDSTLIFTVHLVGLEKKSMVGKLRGLSGLLLWPMCILAVLYYLYRKTKNVPELERKLDRKSGKKRR